MRPINGRRREKRKRRTSLVDVPLIFFCPTDHVPDWQPRVLLGMLEARSVHVKKTTTTTTVTGDKHIPSIIRVGIDSRNIYEILCVWFETSGRFHTHTRHDDVFLSRGTAARKGI